MKVVIIGGGAIGLSLAYHLAGRADVVLLERNQLTSGTSWHAAGIVGPLRATPNMTQLASHALKLFPKLERDLDLSTGYRRTEGYWLARDPARMGELHRIAAVGHHSGLTPRLLTPAELAQECPYLAVDHAGAMAVAEDASVNPVDLCMAYAKGARAKGVDIRENAPVTRILTDNSCVTGVELRDGTAITADQVAICAGAWSVPLATSAGLALPLQAVEHMYVVTEPMPDLPNPFPAIRDLDRGIYIKGDAGKLVIGGFEPDAKCWDAFGPEGDRPFLEMQEDWDQFGPFMQAALALIPALEQTGIQHFMNGPESFTHDTKPLIGQAPDCDGLFVAAGMNSVGVMSSAGVGDVLARWILDGTAPMDLWEVDITRADPKAAEPAHIQSRMAEAVADLIAMHWPYKQPKAGRDLRRTPLHDVWAEQGAQFGVTAGWERPLWYGAAHPYSVGDQHWWANAAAEADLMAQGTALIELSPFTKIDVTGTDALNFLDHICTAQIDHPIGRATYTLILNEQAGIEAELTVTRIGADHFRLTSGAATRWRDLALLRRLAKGTVTITDVTEYEAIIGVMGAGSRALLSGLSDNWQDAPFATSHPLTVAGAPTHATRLSYVGTLGWELSVKDNAPVLAHALLQAGAKPMGYYALDGCRIEKGFKHWGHDLGPKITPLEAGLGFACAKGKNFIGKSALTPPKRRLQLFTVKGGPLLLHDEPVLETGKLIGWTTSGARGPRTGLDLCFGLIDIAPGETTDQIAQRIFEIDVAGKRYSARALTKPPYDPSGQEMRG